MSTLKPIYSNQREGLEKVLHTINHLSASTIQITQQNDTAHRQTYTVYEMLSNTKIGSINVEYNSKSTIIHTQIHGDLNLYTIEEPKDYLKLLFYLSEVK